MHANFSEFLSSNLIYCKFEIVNCQIEIWILNYDEWWMCFCFNFSLKWWFSVFRKCTNRILLSLSILLLNLWKHNLSSVAICKWWIAFAGCAQCASTSVKCKWFYQQQRWWWFHPMHIYIHWNAHQIIKYEKWKWGAAVEEEVEEEEKSHCK